MKIDVDLKHVQLSQIKIGECFLYEDCAHMVCEYHQIMLNNKLDDVLTVNLASGLIYYMKHYTSVNPIKLKAVKCEN